MKRKVYFSLYSFVFAMVSFWLAAPSLWSVPRSEDAIVVTSFGKGHTFKVSPVKSRFNLRDRTDYYPGIGVTESVFMQSGSDGVRQTLRGVSLGHFDFSDKMIKLWMKVENVKNIKDLSVYMGNRKLQNYVRFSLLGHQGQKWITEGDWVPLTFSWNPTNIVKLKLEAGMTLENLRKNITDIQFSVNDNGQGSVKFRISRISAVSEPRKKYPNGVISLTFDDNWASQYTYGKPKLDQYHMAATAYVIVGFLGTPSYMTLDQLKDVQASSNWEIACHAFDPVMHVKGYTKYPLDAVEKDMIAAREWLVKNGFGFGSDGKHGLAHFAYPKGEFKQVGESDVLSLARKHFISARTINGKHREVWPPADPQKLRVLYITGPKTAEEIIAEIEKGRKAGEWIILVLHDLVEGTPTRNDQWEISKFNQLMDYIGTHQNETPVRIIGDVLSDS